MGQTVVGISGSDFTINGQLTYAGRTFEGHRIEGLLFNVRAVQAIFDDENPTTRALWAYPDTGQWDPDRNVDEFCAALESWRAHGVLAFTLNLQGGGAIYKPEIYNTYDNNAFTPDGDLKPAYMARLTKVLARADELGMVVILGLFYGGHIKKLDGEAAIHRAAHNAMAWLDASGYCNVLIEIANELEWVVHGTGVTLFALDRVHEIITPLRECWPRFLYSASQGGFDADKQIGLPTPALIDVVDFLLPHGNGNTAGELEHWLDVIFDMPEYQQKPMPMMINEDSISPLNLDVAWRKHVSWGYYDQGFGSEWGGDVYCDFRGQPRENRYEALSGFQTPPVNWMINTPHKQAFFTRVAQVTGATVG